jgi:hypothetical protein
MTGEVVIENKEVPVRESSRPFPTPIFFTNLQQILEIACQHQMVTSGAALTAYLHDAN